MIFSNIEQIELQSKINYYDIYTPPNYDLKSNNQII